MPEAITLETTANLYAGLGWRVVGPYVLDADIEKAVDTYLGALVATFRTICELEDREDVPELVGKAVIARATRKDSDG